MKPKKSQSVKTVKTQRVVAKQWTWTATKPVAVADPRRPRLRKSQQSVFNSLKDKQLAILTAPTGWGKSLVIMCLIAYKLLRNPKLRCVVAVPRLDIGRNFDPQLPLLLRVLGQWRDWVVEDNLCRLDTDTTVQTACDYLRRPVAANVQFGCRILICTHATLALAYKTLKRRKELAALKNLVLWIDEAHHVMDAEVTDRKETINNALGHLVRQCMMQGAHIGMATATWGRGDKRHILSDKIQDQFERAEIPYDRYWEESRPVESFQFHIHAGPTLHALETIFQTRQPTILYLAKRNSRFAGEDKHLEIRQILRRLSKLYKAPVRRGPETIRIGGYTILDMVTERGRDKRRAYLGKNADKIDIILALDTCKEGFDWPKAERSIILGERHSIPELVQMIGRLFRASPGKTRTNVHQLLPAIVANCRRFKDNRNAYFSVLFGAMLLRNIFIPIPFDGLKETKKRIRTRTDQLLRALAKTKVTQSLMRDFFVAVNGLDYDETLRQGVPESVLSRHGVPTEDWLFIWRQLWHAYALVARDQQGLSLDVPFEILKTVNICDGIVTLASDMCGLATFQECRAAMGRAAKTLEEHVRDAEALAALDYPRMGYPA